MYRSVELGCLEIGISGGKDIAEPRIEMTQLPASRMLVGPRMRLIA